MEETKAETDRRKFEPAIIGFETIAALPALS
jgi:hypothetical protein